MTDRQFTEEIDEYVVLKLALADFRGGQREFPPGCSLADGATRTAMASEEQRLLQRYFRNWKSPFRGRLSGWREDSPLLVVRDGRLIAGVYLCAANEFDADAGWGQLHYAFMSPECKGQGIYSALFREAVQRARAWNLAGLYLNSDRHMLPQVYERWGAVPWKRIRKERMKPPRGRLLRALRDRLFGPG